MFFEVYLNFTVVWFAIGPCEWQVENPYSLYGFLILAHLALWLGYMSAIRRQPARYRGSIQPGSLSKLCVIVSLAWAIPALYIVRTDILGFSDAIGKLIEGVLNPWQAYRDKFTLTSIHSRPTFIVRFSMLLMPLLAMKLPLCVVYWRYLGLKWRFAFLISMLLDMGSWIAIGTLKGIADICGLLPWLLLVLHQRVLLRLSARQVMALMLMGCVCLMVLCMLFTAAKTGPDTYREYGFSPTLYDKPVYRLIAWLPLRLQASSVLLSSYLTQGYYGLSLCLKEPFIPCFGFGHGYFTAEASRRIFGPGFIFARTYPARIDKWGWDPWVNWNSIYPWIASDVSFPGTLMVVFLIGRLLAMAWLDTLRGENPFAVGVLGLLVLMLWYFPANNQVLDGYRQAIAFWFLLICWLATRSRIRAIARCPRW